MNLYSYSRWKLQQRNNHCNLPFKQLGFRTPVRLNPAQMKRRGYQHGWRGEAATYTVKDANDTRSLYHTINSTSNPTKKMRIPSGDTVTWMISPSIKVTVPFRHPEFKHLSAIQGWREGSSIWATGFILVNIMRPCLCDFVANTRIMRDWRLKIEDWRSVSS